MCKVEVDVWQDGQNYLNRPAQACGDTRAQLSYIIMCLHKLEMGHGCLSWDSLYSRVSRFEALFYMHFTVG